MTAKQGFGVSEHVSEHVSELFEYVVAPDDDGMRLDVVVVRALAGKLSRAQVRSLFLSDAVLLSGRPATKNWRARAGDVITVRMPLLGEAATAVLDSSLDVRLERSDLVVVHKPAGQPTTPIRPGEVGTLVNGLVARYPEMAGVGYSPREPGILHRLDTGTSGLLLAARTSASFELLAQSLHLGKIRKEYCLICDGSGLADEGVIDIPIGVDAKHPKRVVACLRAEQIRRYGPRPARTAYRVVERSGRWALVVAEVSKACRHQIRAHFAAIGKPLVGDALYGGDTQAMGRHALHAQVIGLSADVGTASGGADAVRSFEVTCEMPDDMVTLMRSG